MAHRNFSTHPIVLRRLEVARVIDVNPRMRRVTLVGEQLRDFTRDGLALQAFASTGFDDHVKLIFASDGDVASALPVQLAETIDWPDAPNRQMRDYTPRRVDLVSGELDLDFVLHGDGPAVRWALNAAIGDELHIAGPKSSLVMPEDADWVLLAGDETALPAIGRYLDERQSSAPVQIVVEIRHADAEQRLALREGDTIRWVRIADGAPSTLASAVREVTWWPGNAYAWAGAEAASLLPLRRWLNRDRQLPKTHMNVTGYWHEEAHTAAAGSSPAPIDAEALLSPVPWFATRAALSLGLLDAVAASESTIPKLARSLSLAEGAARTLAEYLVSIDVLGWADEDAATLRLGAVGEQVLGDDHLRGSVEDSLESRALLALGELAQATSEGTSAYTRQHGRSQLDDMDASPEYAAEKLADAVGFNFVVRGVLALEPVIAARTVAVSGLGSVALAGALAPERAVTVIESPVLLEVIRAALAESIAEFGGRYPSVHLVISALALASRTEAESLALLRDLATASDRAIVVEELAGPGLGAEHVVEHRLVDLGATGVAIRGIPEITSLVEAAGWTVTRTSTLGWNYEAFELTRP